jgi:hypothetical protein
MFWRLIFRMRQWNVSMEVRRNFLLKRESSPIKGLERPTEFQEIEAPRFPDNRHMKVVGCQPYAPAAFNLQEILISVRG